MIGPGAIGGVMAAALLGSGDHDVVACARTGFDQLVLERKGETTTFDLRCVTDPAHVDGADLVVLATKAFQTGEAAGWLDALCGADTVVAALQNGVEHRQRLDPLIGDAALAPVIVFCPASRSGPGRVWLDGRAMLTVPDDAAGRAVADAFDGTFVDVQRSDDWLSVAWTKLLSNSAGGAITTLARGSNRLLIDSDAAALALALMDEIVAVGRAEGANLPDGIGARVLEGIQALAGDHHSSIVVDRLAGRPTEWSVRNDVVVRKAAEHGIDVPLNRAMTTLLRLGEPSG